MSKRKILGVLLLFLAPLFLWVGLASAQTFRSGNSAIVHKDETVDSSLWASGRTIDVAGQVKGDVFCAGMHVTISGTVDGDVICAAQTITISGRVLGDVRLAAQTIDIGGSIERNASIAGQNFTLTGEGKIGNDLSAGVGDTTLHGEIGRDVAAAGSTLTITNKIGRNIQANVHDITLDQNANVGGNLSYTSTQDAEIADGATVAGSTNRSEPPKGAESDTVLVSGFGFMLYVIASLMVLSLALLFIFPGVLQQVTDQALANPLRVFITGFVAMFAVPAILVILAISLLGIPLALLLLGIWLLLLFLAGPFFSFYLGRLLLRGRSTNPFLAMALGAFIVLVLYFIPILGWMLWIFVMIMGTGMLLAELMRRTPRPQYEMAEATSTAAARRSKK